MVSEAAIKEVLDRIPKGHAEEVKDEEFADLYNQYQNWRGIGHGSVAGSSFLSNLNRTIRNSYGREFAVNNSISHEIKAIGASSSFIREETKYRHSDEVIKTNNN